ncbi:MAG: SDR family oxidoreductase [Bacteroidota bacterium]
MPDNLGVVVVTGAGSGIGYATCEALANAGFLVAALGRRADRLTGYATPSGTVVDFVCDVTDREQVTSCISEITKELGDVRGLVNAAGIFIPRGIEEVTPADIREQFLTNVEGVVTMVQECLPGLRRTRGSIVNLSSLLTRRALPAMSIYVATKGAIEALSRALALELAPDGIRVNVVQPSLIRTEIFTAAGMPVEDSEALMTEWKDMFPLGRVGEPEDVATVIRFLIGDESSWITGADIPITGGRGVS